MHRRCNCRKTYTGTYPNNKQKVNRGEQEQFIIQDAPELIISVEIFEQVQEEMKRRSNIVGVNGKTSRKSTRYSVKSMK
ncbi:recombinase family protein [Clostridium sp. UBA3887]|uniref:recombinase family protein n=1 Tax=Clostridium sp. UBA3887 TaxID=1946356 RepID=UPI0032175260